MAAYCMISILFVFTIYFVQLDSVFGAPTERKNSLADDIDDNIDLKSDEIHYSNEHKHNHHSHGKRRTKRLAVNVCGGQLIGPIQTLTVARHRQAAMNLLKDVIVASKIHLITNNIDVNNFQQYKKHSETYEYLKPIAETDEPQLSEWHHKMQLYIHTFKHLLDHQKKQQRKNLDLTKELEELKLTSEKVLCEIQSIALHLEEKPTLRWITDEEKKTVESNLRTDVKLRHIDEIDLVYSKVFHFDNLLGMTNSLTKCMQDCSCVKGYGECKHMIDF